MGFVDAEGTFIISMHSVTLLFKIELHRDDIEILHKIAQTLGIGKVALSKTRNSAYFYVGNINEIVTVLNPIFQEFSLQTSKHLDYMCFYEAALLKINGRFSAEIAKIKDMKKL